MHGVEAAKRLANLDTPVRAGSAPRCYERVEFDAHRIDTLMNLTVDDLHSGELIWLLLERLWLLALIDSASGTVLGYHVAFGRNYSGEDVLICLENAILPWRPRELRIPGLTYPEGGGLPSGVIPELEYATWGTLAFDNAKSHLSKWVWERISKCIGCTLNPGPVARPNTRPFVERFFRALEENGFHRLPSTTGSSPEDPRRREPEKAALRYKIHFEEILDLVDVLVAQYNATPTPGRYNRSPLDVLRFAIERNSFFVRKIPEGERGSFALAVVRAPVTVRGNLASGVAPFVRFMGARYHSPQLSAAPTLIGRRALVEFHTRDLRQIRLFGENGDEFGILTVSQSWAQQPHDLRVRKAILRCMRDGRIARRGVPDVVQAYIEHKSKEALKRKKPRNELAHVIRLKKQAMPLLPPVASPADVPSAEEPALKRTKPPRIEVKVRSLNF
jgi:transposase InsO family protein